MNMAQLNDSLNVGDAVNRCIPIGKADKCILVCDLTASGIRNDRPTGVLAREADRDPTKGYLFF